MVEEMVMRPELLGCEQHPLSGYRMFRIEYGFECGCPEGHILLPPGVDPDVVERVINEGV